MSRTTRIRVLNLTLHHELTHGQEPLQGSGRTLGAQGAMTAQAAMTARGAMNTAAAMSAADQQAIQQRTLIAETTQAALASQGWTVTMVDGDGADRYTGIEATRGTEHLVAAVGADDLIADQAGAHDCTATVEAITSALGAIGATATVTDDVPARRAGREPLHGAGRPHQGARDRQDAAPAARRTRPTPRGSTTLRASAGDQ